MKKSIFLKNWRKRTTCETKKWKKDKKLKISIHSIYKEIILGDIGD